MPHLVLQHSSNIPAARIEEACGRLLEAMVETGIFPLGGIRVRGVCCAAYAIADRHPDNAFADMILRIGEGRSLEQKSAAGARIMAEAEAVFREELSAPHFALSFEIVEIDERLSWKTNSIHPRLKAQA